jgi:hypothetical protein
VRRIKQQLTASKTSIDKAAEIVQTMADGVRGQLAEISGLIDRAEAAAAAGEPSEPESIAGSDEAPALPAAGTERAEPTPPPRLRDELAGALASSHEGDGGQSSLL